MALGVVAALAVWAVAVPPSPAGAGKTEPGKTEPGKTEPGKTEPGKEEKLKGFLPMCWKSLGLTDSQKQQVYKVQAEYRKKLEALEQQLEQLKEARRKDLEAILTEQQKAELRKILPGKGPGRPGLAAPADRPTARARRDWPEEYLRKLTYPVGTSTINLISIGDGVHLGKPPPCAADDSYQKGVPFG